MIGVEVDRRRIRCGACVGWRYASASRPAPMPSATEWWIFQISAPLPPSSPSMTWNIHSGRVRSYGSW